MARKKKKEQEAQVAKKKEKEMRGKRKKEKEKREKRKKGIGGKGRKSEENVLLTTGKAATCLE